MAVAGGVICESGGVGRGGNLVAIGGRAKVVVK